MPDNVERREQIRQNTDLLKQNFLRLNPPLHDQAGLCFMKEENIKSLQTNQENLLNRTRERRNVAAELALPQESAQAQAFYKS